MGKIYKQHTHYMCMLAHRIIHFYCYFPLESREINTAFCPAYNYCLTIICRQPIHWLLYFLCINLLYYMSVINIFVWPQDRRSARDHDVYIQQQFGPGNNWSHRSGCRHIHVHGHVLQLGISGQERDCGQFL